MKLHQVIASTVSIALLSLSHVASAATWCGATNVKDVICYSDKTCFITADAYGGVRYYRIDGLDPNKNAMVAMATSAFLSKSKVRLVFGASDLNCADIPQNSLLYGVGLTEF